MQIITKNKQQVISSVDIAKQLGVEHRATIQLIDKHFDKLELFGGVTFEMIPFETAGGVQKKKVCYLNEPQAIFLGTLSKNTEKVVQFKALLTKAFNEAKQPQQLSVVDILKLNNQTIEALQAKLEHKQAIIIEKAEKVPAITMRNTINRIIREYAKKQERWYSSIWRELYKEFKYVYNIDLVTRAENSKKSKIQIAEELGKLEELYNLSLKMFEIN